MEVREIHDKKIPRKIIRTKWKMTERKNQQRKSEEYSTNNSNKNLKKDVENVTKEK